MSQNAPSARLVSLDALRGFDMFWILGADEVVYAAARTWPTAPWRIAEKALTHKAWAGFGPYDLIFPLFVFMAGVSITFAIPRHIERYGRNGAIRRILLRGAILVLLGIVCNGGLTHAWPNVRLMGVLQRIGFAYVGAALLFCFFKPRTLAAVGAAILLGYWALLAFVPIRNIAVDRTTVTARIGHPKPTPAEVRAAFEATTTRVTGRYEPGLNVTNHLDYQYLPGRMYDGYWDPEGYLSTLPAVVSCLLGIGAGRWLGRGDRTGRQKVLGLALAGAACLLVGYLWGMEFPVVKKIWTSSFVLVAGGWSLLLLAAFHEIVDVRGHRAWCAPFVWIGMNPITLYLLLHFVDFGQLASRLVGGFDSKVLTSAVALALVFAVAAFLHRRKIFLRV